MRLRNTEDHFTERKQAPQRDQLTESMVAFANSALPDLPGIIYVGVMNDGTVVGGENLESWQEKISSWANGCFPPVPIIHRVLRGHTVEFLTVVVPRSEQRPHFARPAYKRDGQQDKVATQAEIDEWIKYRNSKVRFILDWKGKMVTVQILRHGTAGQIASFAPGKFRVTDCNVYFVTLQSSRSGRYVTHPLSRIDISMDDDHDRLKILLTPYY